LTSPSIRRNIRATIATPLRSPYFGKRASRFASNPKNKFQTCGGDTMKIRVLGVALLAFAGVAGAQTKISGSAHCAKGDPAYNIDVSDHAGHSMMLEKAACTWTTPIEIAGIKTKDGVDVRFIESTATKMTSNGTHVSTMENGDKFYVTFHDSAPVKDGKPGDAKGNWSFIGATGKLKGLKGSGTYVGKFQADGSVNVDVEGSYAMAPAPAPATPKTK
jgi:hypothetical protein